VNGVEAEDRRKDVFGKTVKDLVRVAGMYSSELEEVKAQMDDRGNSMNDTSPMVLIKDALARIKKEIRQMELRIGVSEHSLTHARLKSKTASMLRVGDDGQYETIRSAVANASHPAGQQMY
jgi:predicted RNA-binding protein